MCAESIMGCQDRMSLEKADETRIASNSGDVIHAESPISSTLEGILIMSRILEDPKLRLESKLRKKYEFLNRIL